eukprot:TRINITY_DN20087_c0_g1_i1.p1 TRINITY_DN20087_c0_g1~~TRINITY_DN20087_c0_g1_i1.p1  ORF type:complete len:1025 (-),score=167.62 TRINITY_DN20087_c0_g1_i1:42-3116(-)
MSYRQGDRLVGGYEVIQLLGRGAHGIVLKVKGPSGAGRIRALKVLPCDEPRGADFAARKARDAAFAEARLLQRLRHPHIVGCEDVIWDSGRRAVQLVLEFMDGGDLRGLIEARRSSGEPPFEAHFPRRCLAAVGGALCYIHAAGILHRDVKPANILLTKHSHRIKLGDFGIAKLLETSHANTVVGTPHYLSPEIVAGQAYGEASDAWALGVCIYEVVSRCRPFDAGNQLALVRKICEEPPPPLPEHVAEDVQEAVKGLLIKSVQDRMPIQEALNVSSAVAALVPSSSDSKPPPTRSGMLKKPLGNRATPASRELRVLSKKSNEANTGIAVAAPPRPVISKPRPPSSTASSSSSPSPSSHDHTDNECMYTPENSQLPRPDAHVCNSFQSPVENRSCGSTSSSPSQVSRPSFRPSAMHSPYVASITGNAQEPPSPSSASDGEAAAWETSWSGSDAVAAAREALCGDVDDPEELVRALAALERERDDAQSHGSPERFPAVSSETAIDALESELRVRIAALRNDAAAMLAAVEAEADIDESIAAQAPLQNLEEKCITGSRAAAGNADDGISSNLADNSPRAGYHSSRAPTAYEQALEVATSLGVDTEPSEERLARKRGMLSLRVKWGGVARFCLMPVSVGFDSLVAEVARRFGLPNGTMLPPLSWREAGESFELKSQACWEECLQRRGLLAQPGRLELSVESAAPPPLLRTTVHMRTTRSAALEAFSSAPSPLGQRPELFSWKTGGGFGERIQGGTRSGAGATVRTRAGTAVPAGAVGGQSTATVQPPRSLSRGAVLVGSYEEIATSLAMGTATASRFNRQLQHQQQQSQQPQQNQQSHEFQHHVPQYHCPQIQEHAATQLPPHQQLQRLSQQMQQQQNHQQRSLRPGFGQARHIPAGYESHELTEEVWGAGGETLLSSGASWLPRSRGTAGLEPEPSLQTPKACSGGNGTSSGSSSAVGSVVRSSSRSSVQVRWKVTPGFESGSMVASTGGRDRISPPSGSHGHFATQLPAAPLRVGLQVNGRAVLQ